jgi:asparagine synthase (glutamine-hydrolysing)
MPLSHWFRGDWKGFLRDVLASRACRDRGVFRQEYIERVIRLNDSGRDMSMQLWALASFELWCQAFLDTAGRTRRPASPAVAKAQGLAAPVR